jgi:hypothetical protein
VDAIHLNQLVQHHYRDQDQTGMVACCFRHVSILRSAKYVSMKRRKRDDSGVMAKIINARKSALYGSFVEI